MARERLSLDRGWKFKLGDPEPFRLHPDGAPLANWRWRPAGTLTAFGGKRPAPRPPASGWRSARVGQDVFKGRKESAWFRADAPGAEGGVPRLILTVDDDATVWLNGRFVGRHRGWNESFQLDLSRAWNSRGPNRVLILVENSGGGGGGVYAASLYSGPRRVMIPDTACSWYDDSSWRTVDVPHDYVVERGFDRRGDRSHGYLPKGAGWYRRAFTLPPEKAGQRVWLEFDGVYRDSAVFLNDSLVGFNRSGYTSFMFDVTGLVRFGDRNVVAVRCDAEVNEGWWYEGGGIYRHVRLTTLDPVHVGHWGVFVRTPQVRKNRAVAALTTTVLNEGREPARVEVTSRILGPSGERVGQAVTSRVLGALGGGEIRQSVLITRPRLWSCETPDLYTLVTEVTVGGAVVDSVRTRFGVREFRFDADDGLILNGKAVKIKGTCNHQDFAGVGVALPDRLQRFKLETLKKWGCNGYRCSHHPPAPEILDACDEMGIIVMDENRHIGDSPEIISQVESMVRRDRNHPSIVIWSLCNEVHHQGSEQARREGEAMGKVVNRLDGTRPITAALNQPDHWGEGLSRALDVLGTNYWPERYDGYRRKFPRNPAVSTESHSTVTTRGIYEKQERAGFVSCMSENTQRCWSAVAERPWMSGTFVWTGFDYRGEPTPYDWPCISSHFGFLDTCGFPKDDAFYYRAWWGNEPSVHVFPHWNAEGKKPGQPVKVRCYGNTEHVELLVNGKSAGKTEMRKYWHVDWEVPYEPGAIEVRGYTGGRRVASHRVETTGKPAAVRLVADRTRLDADGEDVAVIRAEIVDSKGRVVPTASNDIAFLVKGPGRIIGVGNGNPSSHEPDRAAKRRSFRGLALVLVQTTDESGPITVRAASRGLRAARVKLAGKRAKKRPAVGADL